MTRTERNLALLAECHPVFRRKVAAILTDLEGHGLKPRLQEAWRLPARQRALRRRGFSKLDWGMHCASTPEGKPDSLAVDFIDEDSPVEPSMRFVLMLLRSSSSHGCLSGALWGLGRDDKARLVSAISRGDWDTPRCLGWDPLHVQIGGISIEDARAGRRPE